MSVLDRTLKLVQTTLDEFDNPNYKLSSVLRKAIRIARLRNDHENLWWLQEEMLADSDKEARNRIKRELLPHYSREQFRRIEHRVHEFLSITEKQLAYGQINSDIFERNRQYVDSRLSAIAPESLEQLVVAYRRVGEGDSEAGSHALLSCRRVLKSLADKLYPAREEPVIGSDGRERTLIEEKYIARLWQFVAERVKGRTAGDLLLAQVKDTGNRIDRLYELDSKGVHADVSEFEVNQAVIQTYLLVGDILRIAEQDSAFYSKNSA
jgi:hypothetical protein